MDASDLLIALVFVLAGVGLVGLLFLATTIGLVAAAVLLVLAFLVLQ